MQHRSRETAQIEKAPACSSDRRSSRRAFSFRAASSRTSRSVAWGTWGGEGGHGGTGTRGKRYWELWCRTGKKNICHLDFMAVGGEIQTDGWTVGKERQRIVTSKRRMDYVMTNQQLWEGLQPIRPNLRAGIPHPFGGRGLRRTQEWSFKGRNKFQRGMKLVHDEEMQTSG